MYGRIFALRDLSKVFYLWSFISFKGLWSLLSGRGYLGVSPQPSAGLMRE